MWNSTRRRIFIYIQIWWWSSTRSTYFTNDYLNGSSMIRYSFLNWIIELQDYRTEPKLISLIIITKIRSIWARAKRPPGFRPGPKDCQNFGPSQKTAGISARAERPPEFRPGPKDCRNFGPGQKTAGISAWVKRPPEFRPGPKDRRNFGPGQQVAGLLARVEISASWIIYYHLLFL